ncbi:hypothetical protein JXA12_00820 [Candidatus Woesearchaeota archaeon]|nr:hypothetical protein [Candidatus Woesearchaeota archaeon]
MNKRTLHLAVLILLLGATISFLPWLLPARQGHLTLLTVTTVNGTEIGGTADVTLKLTPGKGDVYITTYPFTKLDTQISTRFAKEVACAYTEMPCDNHDFFYTIHADSSIIGGPSAGAALTALTIALLEQEPIDQGVAITGTINSGGIVGPVGGIDAKAAAAAAKGLHTVIVPRWQQERNNTHNESLLELALIPGPSIAIVEVATIEEALTVLTGEPHGQGPAGFTVPKAYTELMEAIAERMCDHSDQLRSTLDLDALADDPLLNQSESYLADAELADERGNHYSKASYCFSANLRLRELQLMNATDEALVADAEALRETINERLADLQERPLITFSDLQTKAIVDERLREAAGYLEQEPSPNSLAYAMERYRSAIIWSNFFQLPGEPIALEESHLRSACEAKLAEVEERKSYIDALFGPLLAMDEASVKDAYAMYRDGDYALCLSEASMAKAQIDTVISSISMDEDDLDMLVGEKLRAAERVLSRESSQGRFPVMGYSYYEYASSLREEDPYTATLFSSYALELADLSMYFPSRPSWSSRLRMALSSPFMIGFIAGMLVAFILVVLVFPQKKRARRRP